MLPFVTGVMIAYMTDVTEIQIQRGEKNESVYACGCD